MMIAYIKNFNRSGKYLITTYMIANNPISSNILPSFFYYVFNIAWVLDYVNHFWTPSGGQSH